MIAMVVGEFQRHEQAAIQAAMQRAGAQCIFASTTERAEALLRSLESAPRCVFASVKADLSTLAEFMRDSVEFYTIPIVALVPYPSSDSYQLANRQGADDCTPEYDHGGMTRRIANLFQGSAPQLPTANMGNALVAISDEKQRKHIGRRLRSAGYHVEFISAEDSESYVYAGTGKPAVIVTTPSTPPGLEFITTSDASPASEPRPIPRVNIPLSTGDLISPRDLSELEVSERLMFLVDEATRPIMNDARSSRRIQHSAISAFRAKRNFEHTYALTDNISRQGLYLRTLDPPPVGADVRVDLRDKYGDILQIRGTVAWRFAPSQVGGRTCPGFGLSISEAECPRDDLEKYRALYADVLSEVERIEARQFAPARGVMEKPSGVHRTVGGTAEAESVDPNSNASTRAR